MENNLAQPKPTHGYVGWLLPETERDMLLTWFKPAFPDVVAHHVTEKFGVTDTYPLPTATRGVIVGIATDGEAVQALVVEIDGTTTRNDGSTYHITWSLNREKGAKPVMSNKIIAEKGWEVTKRFPIHLEPMFFENEVKTAV